MPGTGNARIRIHRTFQCWEILAYQYAGEQKGSRKNIRKAGKNATDQSFPDQRYLVPGRSAGLWLCLRVQEQQGSLGSVHPEIYFKAGKLNVPDGAPGFPLTTSEDRPGIHGLAGRK